MLLILSQKIDSESTYDDKLFTSYHYPARYKNQLHEGDTFVYYQGNRFDISQRYYFGVGTIGEIHTTDGENYYAKLLDCQKFEKKVPIYLPDGGYIEQLGYDTVRNSSTPPWQSSVRPLSQEAFDYILKAAGIQLAPTETSAVSVDEMKENLKQSIREFFVEADLPAIHRIESISAAIGRAIFGEENQETIDETNTVYQPDESSHFGVGTIGEIHTTDGENYYAKLLDCQKFEKKVPIYLPDGGYIEQLGYDTVRNSSTPPWQSSVRPLSQEAFDYILKAAGIQLAPTETSAVSVDEMKENLKQSIREFFVEADLPAIHRIESISAAIGRAIFGEENQETIDETNTVYQPDESSRIRLKELLEYCQTMKMSYSYKPVLIMALLCAGDKNGQLAIDEAARYFRNYYNERRAKGLPVEKKNCIYQRTDITEQQIAGNVRTNPVRALVESGFFFYDEKIDVFSLDPAIWGIIDKEACEAIIQICHQRLDKYYSA